MTTAAKGTWLLLVVMAAPLLVVAAQFTAVRPTNFAGADEWLVLSLSSRGIIDFPYAGRPLALLWCLPGLLVRHDVIGHLLTQVFYLAIGGALVAWIAARRLGLSPAVALLAGVLTAAWAPLDRMRLDPVVTTRYSGSTWASLAAMLLFVEGWRRGRPLVAAMGAVVAVVTVLSLEGTLPLLAGAPLIALAVVPETLRDGKARRRLLLWFAAWEIVLVGAAIPLLLSMAGLRGGGYQYQSRIGLDPHPVRLVQSLVQQLAFSMVPLVSTPPGELVRRSVPLALAAFSLAFFAVSRGTPPDPDARASRRTLARTAALGAALATLGWLGLVLGPLLRTPARAQFLSAPGVGLLLAGSLALLASRVPSRARPLVLALAGAWVVAVGTARIGAMQDDWDRTSVWPGQRGTLVQLVEYAPSLAPNTLVVLIDESRSWTVTLIFRHALHYLYGEGVIGHVWQGIEFLYPAKFLPDGIRSEPWPVIQKAWHAPPTFHRYDEVLVARFSADGRLHVLDEWPLELGPLPPGAAYAPRDRVGPGPPPPSARILARER
jgi:hypothetical protein